MEETLYTVEDVARRTGLTRRTIQNYLKRGTLQGRKIGAQWRFTEENIEALFRDQRVDPVQDFLMREKTEPETCTVIDVPAGSLEEVSPVLRRAREKLLTWSEPPKLYADYLPDRGLVRITVTGELKKVIRVLRQFRKDDQE